MSRATTGELFEYGIHTEGSDIRAHVSVVHRSIFVFPTMAGVQAIEKHKSKLRTAYASQNGVSGITAEGWLVPPELIGGIRKLPYHNWPGWDFFDKKMSTSEKGKKAVSCVLSAMQIGRFPFWIHATEDDRASVQIKGTDILVFCKKRVQVKCDYDAGPKPEGSGYLFLQKSERNPLRCH